MILLHRDETFHPRYLNKGKLILLEAVQRFEGHCKRLVLRLEQRVYLHKIKALCIHVRYLIAVKGSILVKFC